jgi:hypothetical protein
VLRRFAVAGSVEADLTADTNSSLRTQQLGMPDVQRSNCASVRQVFTLDSERSTSTVVIQRLQQDVGQRSWPKTRTASLKSVRFDTRQLMHIIKKQ